MVKITSPSIGWKHADCSKIIEIKHSPSELTNENHSLVRSIFNGGGSYRLDCQNNANVNRNE